MKDILSEIIANKRFEVDLQKQAISIEQLQEGINEVPASRSMKRALASSDSGIIAEFKRRSPSKGWIKQEARPEEIVPSYLAAGASALSILTDEKFFGGSLKDIRTARPLVDVPIIRKDFIIDEYQLYQAKIVGADAVLLMRDCLFGIVRTRKAESSSGMWRKRLFLAGTRHFCWMMTDVCICTMVQVMSSL